MKKIIHLISFCIVIYGLFFFYENREQILSYGVKTLTTEEETNLPENNAYYKNYNFKFVQNTDNFNPNNKQDILNIIYTGLNKGSEEFSFYCSDQYENCLNDINTISSDKTLLSVINNFVSPYNSYSKLYITSNQLGKVTITLDKLYTESDILIINNKIDSIEKEIINQNMTNKQKIKAMHDYLVNNSIYDSERANNIKAGMDSSPKYPSHKANGPLLQGISLCSGYSDAMKIYLDRLNLPNYKVSNTDHIWNLVYLDDKWLHLDLTWDDPVTPDKQNLLLHKFFLINTPTLLSLDPTGHTFNKEYYSEAQ